MSVAVLRTGMANLGMTIASMWLKARVLRALGAQAHPQQLKRRAEPAVSTGTIQPLHVISTRNRVPISVMTQLTAQTQTGVSGQTMDVLMVIPLVERAVIQCLQS